MWLAGSFDTSTSRITIISRVTWKYTLGTSVCYFSLEVHFLSKFHVNAFLVHGPNINTDLNVDCSELPASVTSMLENLLKMFSEVLLLRFSCFSTIILTALFPLFCRLQLLLARSCSSITQWYDSLSKMGSV